MRLDLVLDSFYIWSSLWARTPGPQVCGVDRDIATIPEAAAVAHWSPGRGRAVSVMAFVDVNVVPMDTERVLAHQTVVVEGGRITALGPSHRIKVPAEALRIDGRGKYLMPGLADMHYGPEHQLEAPVEGKEQVFADRLFRKYVAYGVTVIRSLGGSSSRDMQRLRRLFAEHPVPRLYLAPSRVRVPAQPDSLAVALAAMRAAGYSHIVDATKVDSATLTALHRAGLPLAVHDHGRPFPQVLQLGIAGGSTEHLYVFWDSLLGEQGAAAVNPHAPRHPEVTLPMAKVPALVAALRRAGVWITPSLRCMESVHPYIKDQGLGRLVKALQDGGVKMLLGGDNQALALGSVHSELVAMVRAGLTPYQALVTGTRNVAEYFHVLDSAGTVAVGKQADLILLSGNPLQDIRHTWEPAGVMINGRWLDRAALDQRLVASPPAWFELLLQEHIPFDHDPAFLALLSYWLSSSRSREQWQELEQRVWRVYTLADSLGKTDHSAYGRVLPLVAAELGAIRAMLTPEQRVGLDVNLRVWQREQARQGYAVVVPGVTPAP